MPNHPPRPERRFPAAVTARVWRRTTRVPAGHLAFAVMRGILPNHATGPRTVRKAKAAGHAASGRAAGLALAVALGEGLLCSCGTGTKPPPPEPVSAWQRVQDQIGPDGQVSKNTALAAFVLAIGQLPGVPRPPGQAQMIPDGSGAVRWLLGYYSELTPGQQSAIRRLLSLPALAARSSGAHPAAELAAAFTGATPGTALDVQIEQAAARAISARLGVQLTSGVQIFENGTEQPANGKPALMYTYSTDASGGFNRSAPVARCVIHINPSAHQLSGGDAGNPFKATMTHEVFHCFENQLAGTIGAYLDAARAESWLYEGAASWAASDLVADSPGARALWQDYLGSPARSLFSRSYDAIGFFGHLYPGGGISPWNVFPAMFRAVGNVNAYDAAISGASAAFLDSEASVFFGNPSLGSAWYQHGDQAAPAGTAAQSVVPAARSPVRSAGVSAGPWVSFRAEPYTDQVLALHLSAPVTEFSLVYGHARLHAADRAYELVNPSVEACTTASGRCQGCKAASSPSDLPAFGSAADLALAGGPDGTLLRVRGISLKEFCDQPGQSGSQRPADCGNLPRIGTTPSSSAFGREHGFTVLSCWYSTSGNPVGFIQILTYPSPAAAQAAWRQGGIRGARQPGFAVTVIVGLSCLTDGGCLRHEFALDGNRIDEIAESSDPLNPLPSLEQTNTWMHELLAST